MSDDRQIDQQQVLDHIDNVLQDCEQVFEKFFLAKFIGLRFEYFPENVNDAEKDLLKKTYSLIVDEIQKQLNQN